MATYCFTKPDGIVYIVGTGYGKTKVLWIMNHYYLFHSVFKPIQILKHSIVIRHSICKIKKYWAKSRLLLCNTFPLTNLGQLLPFPHILGLISAYHKSSSTLQICFILLISSSNKLPNYFNKSIICKLYNISSLSHGSRSSCNQYWLQQK